MQGVQGFIRVRQIGLLTAAATAVILGALVDEVRATSVAGVRHAVTDGNTRIVIDLSGKSTYEVVDVRNPDRIAINLPDTRLSSRLASFTIDHGSVKRVRFNRLSWGTQVVLDLRESARWSEFFLAPMDGMPGRVVLDVESLSARASLSVPMSLKRKVHLRARPEKSEYVIAVDAGHGGHDPGAIGKGNIKEKKVALDIARRLVRIINSQEGYKAFLTRDKDIYLTLSHRTQIANEEGADIFVSIHLNSAPRRSARGSEVFFLSPAGAKQTANRLLANQSNAARELGLAGNSSSDILQMLVDVNQQSMMERSSSLAEEILKALDRKDLAPTRSIKQRSFAVLKSIDIPSVIVETGFLTNSKDRAIFKRDSGKQKIAEGVASGVFSYLKKHPPAQNQERRMVVHKVRKGDTLWKISRRYNTSVASIQHTNQLGRSKMIRIGQELVIREGHETTY